IVRAGSARRARAGVSDRVIGTHAAALAHFQRRVVGAAAARGGRTGVGGGVVDTGAARHAGAKARIVDAAVDAAGRGQARGVVGLGRIVGITPVGAAEP